MRKKKYNLLPIEDAGRITVPDEDRQMHEEYLRIGRMLETLPEEQAEIKVRMPDGKTRKYTIALKKDAGFNSWLVDGGI